MPTLLVEDGTGVANANSFATLAQARDYAVLRGTTLSSSDPTLTAQLVIGTDYIKTLSFLGTKTYPGQSYLPWPRTGLQIDGEDFPADAVPTDIVSALCQLCIEQQRGVKLFASTTGPAIKREKIGPLDTEYAVPSGSGNAAKASMPLVDALLKPYTGALSGFSLRVDRA